MAAYDLTLEGWSNALELRDSETQGHSKRVVDLTIEIALQMGISSEKLIHIRRGALLHDIGKVGIPDSILLKPGICLRMKDSQCSSIRYWLITCYHPLNIYIQLWIFHTAIMKNGMALVTQTG